MQKEERWSLAKRSQAGRQPAASQQSGRQQSGSSDGGVLSDRKDGGIGKEEPWESTVGMWAAGMQCRARNGIERTG